MGPHVARPTARAVATVGAAGTDHRVTEQPAARTRSRVRRRGRYDGHGVPDAGERGGRRYAGPRHRRQGPERGSGARDVRRGRHGHRHGAARPVRPERSAPARRLDRPGRPGAWREQRHDRARRTAGTEAARGGPEPTAVPGADRATGACVGGRAPPAPPGERHYENRRARPVPPGPRGRRPPAPGRSGAPPADAPVAAASAIAGRVHERAAGSAGRGTAGECAPARGPLNPA